MAETTLPLAPAEVFEFLRGLELPFRLNPLLAIERWQPAEWGFRYAAYNESNDRRIDVGVLVEVLPGTIELRYDAGLKQATRLVVEPAGGGCRLVVTETYPRIEYPQDPRVAEVDKSLLPWVAALRRHLLARERWGRLPGWRWWNEVFLPAMPPRGRRIVRLLLWISALEFAVFLGAVAALRLSGG